MARIGLNNFRYGVLTADNAGVPTYSGAFKPAKAVSCNVSITNNDAKLYADDVVAESDTSFQSGTVSMGIDDEDLSTVAVMLGHAYNDGVLVRSSNDSAPYIGLGRVVVKMINGVYKYKVEFLYKVKMSEPSAEEQTKGENLEFGTSTLEGNVMMLSDGKWSVAKVFDTNAEAITYLEGLLGGGGTIEYTITYNANGGSGSVASVTVDAGETVTLSDGTGLTAPATKTFGGWSKNPSATVATVSSPYMPTDDCTLYAVWVS